MKLDMPLLKHESKVLFDWDGETFVVYYKDGSQTRYFGIWKAREWPDEFLEWLPEQ